MNLQSARHLEKEQYNKRATEHELQVGRRVLMPLPGSTSTFLNCWQDPFVIVWQAGSVEYKVLRPGYEEEKKIYCVCLLKLCMEREDLWITSLSEKEVFGHDIERDVGIILVENRVT